MSHPIALEFPAQPNHRNGAHLNEAHAAHEAAILSAYDLLQSLHDHGILELLRGVVGAGDDLVQIVSKAANTPEGTRALRNFILLTKFFGCIRPELLHGMVDTILSDTDRSKHHEPASLLTLLRRFQNKDIRRGLALALDLLEGVGRGA